MISGGASSASKAVTTAPRVAWHRYPFTPDGLDVAALRERGVPVSLLAHAGDPHERPRLEREGEALLVVLHYPSRYAADPSVPFVTRPVSVILTPEVIVTLAPDDAAFLRNVGDRTGEAEPGLDGPRFIAALLLALANEYVTCLEAIDAAVGALEARLTRSLRNREVLELLKYEKSLVYFTTALRANELVVTRLQKGGLPQPDADAVERLENALIELRQAIGMAEISENILAQMMDAFASIVSNNLNDVMKVLTSVTILVSVPTLIASVYGMNVMLPGAASRGAFAALVLVSALSMAALALVFRRQNWL